MVAARLNQLLNEPTHSLCGLLLDALETADLQGAMAPIKHPLGFLRVPVLKSETDSLSFNVWTSAIEFPRSPTSGIHSHNWTLSSRVLLGTIANEVYAQEEDLSAGSLQIFEIRRDGDRDDIRATGEYVSCSLRSSKKCRAGERYEMPAGIFHRSFPEGSALCATLLLSSGKSASPEYVLGATSLASYQQMRNQCTPFEVRKVLEIFKDSSLS